jgi:two-component system response regulator GlrR
MSREKKILLVDDDRDLLQLIAMRLTAAGYAVSAVESGEAALAALAVSRPQVVVTDLRMQGMDGMALFDAIHRDSPSLPVVILTAHGTIPEAVTATRRGVFSFLTKPFEPKVLLDTVAEAMRLSSPMVGDMEDWRAELITRSSAMEDLLAQARRVAASDASVCLYGASGTGKELMARAIHRASPRGEAPFVAVNCGAIPEGLLESELFGHKKGSFTGAVADRRGLFQAAQGGTLFLDEIGNLSLPLQAKLLGVLQTGSVTRVGTDTPIRTDARIVCATNLARDDLLDKQRFRQDLLYRINTIEIHVPPLREREDDIHLLVDHYAQRFAKKYGKSVAPLPDATRAALRAYSWPGNVRELVHAVERTVIMAEDSALKLEHLLLEPRSAPTQSAQLNLEALEKDAIRRAVAKHGGNLSKAAQELGLGRTTLYRKMARHGLQ